MISRFILSMALLAVSFVVSAEKTTNNIVQATSLSSNEVIHLGKLNLATGQLASKNSSGQKGGLFDTAWDNTTFIGSFRGTTTEEIVDTGDLPANMWVDQFQIGFATDASSPVTLRISFYQTDAFNNPDPIVPLLMVNGAPAVYDITTPALPGGGLFGYTFDIAIPEDMQFRILGADLDTDGMTDWGYGYFVVDGGNGTAIGPSIAAEGPDAVGAPGRFDAFDVFDPPGTYAATSFFGGVPFAQFHMRLRRGSGPSFTVPTLNSYGLVALGIAFAMGGVFLGRRRFKA